METLIRGLIIAIAVCVVLLIVFSISDAIKKKKNKGKPIQISRSLEQTIQMQAVDSLLDIKEPADSNVIASPFSIDNLIDNLKQTKESEKTLAPDLEESELGISEPNNEIKLDKDKKTISETTSPAVSNNSTQKPVENNEILITKEVTGEEILEDTAVSEKITKENLLENTSKNETNKGVLKQKDIIVNEDDTTDSKDTLVAIKTDSYKEILEKIVREYQQSLIKDDVVAIKYLSDSCVELNYDKGTFYLRNEEIMINGFLQSEEDIYKIKAGDTVIIRFCVNFSIPDGYDIKVEADELALRSKQLELINISNAPDGNTSIRATVSAKADGTINKWEKLFSVRVMKEVIL